MKNALDTRNFDKFDEEEPWFFESNAKNVKTDMNFVGYTYKRDNENERSEVVNALENLERNRQLLSKPIVKENIENLPLNMEKTLTHNIFKGLSNSKSPITRNTNTNNNNNNGNLGKALINFQSNNANNGILKEKALLINLYNNNNSNKGNLNKDNMASNNLKKIGNRCPNCRTADLKTE